MNRFKEKSEISLHLLKVWSFLKNQTEWVTNKDVSDAVGFSDRTVRSHTLYLVRSGLVDQVEVFPGHRYKVAVSPDKRNINFLDRLNKASEVMGLS